MTFLPQKSSCKTVFKELSIMTIPILIIYKTLRNSWRFHTLHGETVKIFFGHGQILKIFRGQIEIENIFRGYLNIIIVSQKIGDHHPLSKSSISNRASLHTLLWSWEKKARIGLTWREFGLKINSSMNIYLVPAVSLIQTENTEDPQPHNNQ